MCSERVIDCRGVGKAYRHYGSDLDRLKELVLRRPRGDGFWALRDVDLEVRRGEAVGIIGRNGSGKSTLLQMICGTLQPSCGQIRVQGRIAALLELGAGFNPDFTGRENVELSASVLGLSSAEIAARLPGIEAFADIGDFIDLPVRQYSSGMYARLAFAVCAHVDANVLVVDELLAVGDVEFQQRCMRFMHGFRQRGTLLFVSHDESAVLSLCERAVWLDRGRVRGDGPSKEICRSYLSDAGGAARSDDAAALQAGGHVAAEDLNSRPIAANPIEFIAFDLLAPSHGLGGAVIEDVSFYRPGGEKLSWAHGGEVVDMRVNCRAQRRLTQAIVGYLLRNARGINLFGDNTYPTYRNEPPAVDAGDTFVAHFRLQLPLLPEGEFGLSVAITEGSQADHTHVHWMEHAVVLRVAASPVRHSLIGLPMTAINLEQRS